MEQKGRDLAITAPTDFRSYLRLVTQTRFSLRSNLVCSTRIFFSFSYEVKVVVRGMCVGHPVHVDFRVWMKICSGILELLIFTRCFEMSQPFAIISSSCLESRWSFTPPFFSFWNVLILLFITSIHVSRSSLCQIRENSLIHLVAARENPLKQLGTEEMKTTREDSPHLTES